MALPKLAILRWRISTFQDFNSAASFGSEPVSFDVHPNRRYVLEWLVLSCSHRGHQTPPDSSQS